MQLTVAPSAPEKLVPFGEIVTKLVPFGGIQAFTVEILVAFEETTRLQKCTSPINR
jgi:hypothetical protein